jgi:hypothetical protein
MRSLDLSLEELVKGGLIKREEAARHAEDPRRFAPRAPGAGSGTMNVGAAATAAAAANRPDGS